MDAAQRRKLLSEKLMANAEKLMANAQRRNREELLGRLPAHLSTVLSVSPCIYSSAIDPILQRFLPFAEAGIGPSAFVPPDYHYAEVAWEEKMLALANRLVVPQVASPAFLWLHEEFPLFVVDFRWAISLLKDLWDQCDRGLFVVEKDLRAGLLIIPVIGYLPEDPCPSETLYEVAVWPAQSADGTIVHGV